MLIWLIVEYPETLIGYKFFPYLGHFHLTLAKTSQLSLEDSLSQLPEVPTDVTVWGKIDMNSCQALLNTQSASPSEYKYFDRCFSTLSAKISHQLQKLNNSVGRQKREISYLSMTSFFTKVLCKN